MAASVCFAATALCAAEVLGDVRETADLGEDFGGGLYERELAYFVEQRVGARRRTTCSGGARKCGLHMTAAAARAGGGHR